MKPASDESTSAGTFQRCNLFELEQEKAVAHDGLGEILFRRIATSADISGACNFLDFTTMPPGSSIGKHTHRDSEEEYYLILRGRGRMQQNGEEFEVKAGDLICNPPGGTHALQNIGGDILQMFVFEVQVL